MVLFRRYCPLVLRGLVYLDWVLFLDLFFGKNGWIGWLCLVLSYGDTLLIT